MNRLPHNHGLTLRRLAMKVAEMQDAGVARGKVHRWAKEFYSRMKLVCQHYAPYEGGPDKNYLDTMCAAGFNGTTPCGDGCTECPVFDYHFHPAARPSDVIAAPAVRQARLARMAAQGLIQIQ